MIINLSSLIDLFLSQYFYILRFIFKQSIYFYMFKRIHQNFCFDKKIKKKKEFANHNNTQQDVNGPQKKKKCWPIEFFKNKLFFLFYYLKTESLFPHSLWENFYCNAPLYFSFFSCNNATKQKKTDCSRLYLNLN